jgi:hypothetical protein
MCLEHHDAYDSRSNQSKRFTPDEVKHYRTELHEAMHREFDLTVTFSSTTAVVFSGPVRHFVRVNYPSHTSADIRLTPISPNGEVHVTGGATWGLWGGELDTPHEGELGFVSRFEDGRIEHSDSNYGDYRIVMHIYNDTLEVEETSPNSIHGQNVTFSGTYRLAN